MAVQLSPDGGGMSPAWEADDEPSRGIWGEMETGKIPFRLPTQGRVAVVHTRGHQGIQSSFVDLGIGSGWFA